MQRASALSFGIEEEYFVVDSDTGRPAKLPWGLRRDLLEIDAGECQMHSEWLRCQFESATPVCRTVEAATRALGDFRVAFEELVRKSGYAALASGTVPDFMTSDQSVSPEARFQEIYDHVPGIGREQYLSGQHVHVGIDTPEEAVVALNYLRGWLPTLNAMGANSPLWKGQLSGFSSWRTVHYRRWSVNGVPPHFQDLSDYTARTTALEATKALLDQGHIGWAARLSHRHPTVEVRVFDVQPTIEEAVFLALVVVALVSRSGRNRIEPETVPQEMSDLALWHSARFGLNPAGMDDGAPIPIPTPSGITLLREIVMEEFSDSPHVAAVERGFALLTSRGNGAFRQQSAFERGGVANVLSAARTEFALRCR